MAKKDIIDHDLADLEPPQEDEIQKKLISTANKIEHYQLVAYDPFIQMVNHLYCLPGTFVEDTKQAVDRRAKNYLLYLRAIEDLNVAGFDIRTASKRLVERGISATLYKADHKLRWFQQCGLIATRTPMTPTTKAVYEISQKALDILNTYRLSESTPA